MGESEGCSATLNRLTRHKGSGCSRHNLPVGRITAVNLSFVAAGLVLAVAALGALYIANREGLPHRIVVSNGTMQQFTYSHVIGHTVTCTNGAVWRVTPTPRPISTTEIRVQFIGDGYVNVFCPR